MGFLPFDYLVVSNPPMDSDALKDLFSFFTEHGIRKFIFLLDFDRTRCTLSQIKERQKNLNARLRSIHPRGIIAETYLNLILSNGVVYDPSIASLFAKKTPFLFVKTPVMCDESWIDSDLNYLLYKMNLLPILTSFEENLRTNAHSRMDQILRSKAYRMTLDLNYITALDSDVRMMQIISREISVFPSITHDLSNYVGIEKAMLQYKSRLGDHTYGRLCRNFLNTEQNFFSA